MINMKFSDRSEYDDLENSIVDSLSEVSIASNVQLNSHTQEIINKTISDVISIYLWSSDTSTASSSSRVNKSSASGSTSGKSRKSKSSLVNEQPEIEKQIKSAWDSVDLKQSGGGGGSNNAVVHSEHIHKSTSAAKKDDKANKMPVPYLDLSYLSENSTINNSNEETSTSKMVVVGVEEVAANKKGLTRQKSHESNVFTVTPVHKSSDLKSKTSDSNIKRNDYQNHTTIKHEIESLLKELKLNKNTDSSEYFNQDNELKLGRAEQEKLFLMAVNLRDLLTRLLEKRKAAKRNTNVEKMTREEILSEKVDTQKELLAFEEKHGRPQTKLEKDLMRPLYDHYRKVKRILSKSSSTLGNDVAEDQPNVADEEDILMSHYKDNKHFINMHSMNLNELNKEKESSLLEKGKLKDVIKKYENDFNKATGRNLSKEDRDYHKEDFEKYKFLKAKLKFIDALIEKHETNKK